MVYSWQAAGAAENSVCGPGDLSLDGVHYSWQCIVGLTTDVKQGHKLGAYTAFYSHSCGGNAYGYHLAYIFLHFVFEMCFFLYMAVSSSNGCIFSFYMLKLVLI